MTLIRFFACLVLLIVALGTVLDGGMLMMTTQVSGSLTDLQLVWVRGAILFGSGLVAVAMLVARLPWDSARELGGMR